MRQPLPMRCAVRWCHMPCASRPPPRHKAVHSGAMLTPYVVPKMIATWGGGFSKGGGGEGSTEPPKTGGRGGLN